MIRTAQMREEEEKPSKTAESNLRSWTTSAKFLNILNQPQLLMIADIVRITESICCLCYSGPKVKILIWGLIGVMFLLFKGWSTSLENLIASLFFYYFLNVKLLVSATRLCSGNRDPVGDVITTVSERVEGVDLVLEKLRSRRVTPLILPAHRTSS